MGYLEEHAEVLLTCGARSISTGRAAEFVNEYLNGNSEDPRSRKPFAYPAYDGYPGSLGPSIGPQDFFAPSLLNVPMRRLRSYYDFLGIVPVLNARLRQLDEALKDTNSRDLGSSSDEIIAVASKLYGVLDEEAPLFGIGLTTLAKILHRKRPAVLPLWDVRVERCYCSDSGAPVPPVRGRSWEHFAVVWLGAVRADITRSPDAWRELAALVPADGPAISSLRALDIVAWRVGQEPSRPPREDPASPGETQGRGQHLR